MVDTKMAIYFRAKYEWGLIYLVQLRFFAQYCLTMTNRQFPGKIGDYILPATMIKTGDVEILQSICLFMSEWEAFLWERKSLPPLKYTQRTSFPSSFITLHVP